MRIGNAMSPLDRLRKGLLALALAASTSAVAAPVLAQVACGPALAQCDLQQDEACLKKTYACGNYETVIQTLFVEDLGLTDDQKYFLGASFYGLYVRERAKGLECEMVKFGREQLSDYLGSLQQKFSESGSFGTVGQMDQLYHGTQMLDALNAVNGCVESAFTRARIQTIAKSEALDRSKNVFLNPPTEAKQAFDTLLIALRSFVSRASDLETGIALRRVEIQSARNHLAAIGEIFKKVFGTVSISGPAVTVDTSTLDSLAASSSSKLTTVAAEEADFKAALGDVSAEEYANIRSQNVANAEQLLKDSAFHINMIGKALPTDTVKPFWRLVDALNTENAGKSASDDLAAVRQSWRERGDQTGICAQPQAAQRVWYCR